MIRKTFLVEPFLFGTFFRFKTGGGLANLNCSCTADGPSTRQGRTSTPLPILAA
jgi:hypothetical protein